MLWSHPIDEEYPTKPIAFTQVHYLPFIFTHACMHSSFVVCLCGVGINQYLSSSFGNIGLLYLFDLHVEQNKYLCEVLC
jgi:hypothetical protein